MRSNANAAVASGHLLTSDIRPRMAKADLRKAETSAPDGWSLRIGSAIERVRMACRLSLKEFADAIGRDERQVARWIAGTERPQFDRIFAVDDFRDAVVVALAELAGERVEVVTEIRVRRCGGDR